MAETPDRKKTLRERLSRSSYFFGALLLHLIIFVMVATLIIFPAFHPPVDEFQKSYLPPSTPPPPPPQQTQTVQVPTHTVAPITPTITTPNAAPTFNVPLPDFTHETTPDNVTQKMQQQVKAPSKGIPSLRLAKIMETEKAWGRSEENIQESNSDPRNVVAKFPVYMALLADDDWSCNVRLVDGKIDTGSIPNLVAKIVEWSKNNIKAEVVPEPLVIAGPELMEKRPPFIFFTGHKDFVLTDQEISNLRDYLQVGGAIWGDNALAGRGSRFDVAFRREMKRVVPDPDKNFEPIAMDDPIFTKSWYNITKLPPGMNYYAEPMEHLDIDDKLAILYTPDDYSDMMDMRILPGDTTQLLPYHGMPPHTLATEYDFWYRHNIFYRNFEIDSCLAVQKMDMNIVGYMLVRFDDQLLLTP